MWWNWNSNGRQRGSLLWIIVPIIILVLLSNRSWGWGWSWWWLIFIIPCVLGPKIWRSTRGSDSGEKPKNDFDFEKPKRSFTRDDGEQFEIIDEEPQPSKRRTPPDDIEYV